MLCRLFSRKARVTVLLLDLDDTLLGNPMDAFLPAYLQGLGARLAAYVEPQRMIRQLLAATKEMSANRLPDRTLENVFDAAFYPALGLIRAEVQPALDAFYSQDFPALQQVTLQRPEAMRLVEQALQRGVQVGVATNPLFPRTAIEQRLAWAGLPVTQTPFALVPSFETFHFAKPNPAYYAEFLAQMGWPEGPVLMVGNDLEMDLLPARQLGLEVFWTPAGEQPAWEKPAAAPPQGGLGEVLAWLEALPGEQVQPETVSVAALLAVLRSTPAALATLCRSRAAESLAQRPEPQAWSPVEVLCHLRDVEIEVNLPRLRKVLAEQNPFLPGQDTDPWAEKRQYIRQDARQALHEYTAARIELLTLLEDLPEQEWAHPARHAIFGPTHLRELAQIIAGHDRLHVRQCFHAL